MCTLWEYGFNVTGVYFDILHEIGTDTTWAQHSRIKCALITPASPNETRCVQDTSAPPSSKVPSTMPGLAIFPLYCPRPHPPSCSIPFVECGQFDWPRIGCGSSVAGQLCDLCRGARWWACAQAPSAWLWLACCTLPRVARQVPSLGARQSHAACYALLPEPATPHPY
jgi:hypothetical protein